ncbi:3-hydroxyacyl-CoA dehydrogenase family protein [Streptomyces sp. NPDC051677]|uniref:3-hydroxyacyl-CoA dehydrogenase family protein n=1 Tax=Streptomyces sp. NPDC051677 TaxID=3365669 RepID=UPI0037CFB141
MAKDLVAVVGVGVMGVGIARMCLEAGYRVALADRSPTVLDDALGSLSRLDPHYPSLIAAAPLVEAVDQAALVIDATPQLVDAKADLLRQIGEIADADTLIGTVSVATPLQVLDPGGALTARLIGLHFMNPPHRLRLCEVVVRDGVDRHALDRATTFLADLSVTAIEVADTPAFVLNRIFVPFLLDAVRVLERGQASAADIDLAFTKGCGHPMGPLRILDLLGIEVSLRSAIELHEAYPDDPRFEPPQLLRRMAERGERFHPAPKGRGRARRRADDQLDW